MAEITAISNDDRVTAQACREVDSHLAAAQDAIYRVQLVMCDSRNVAGIVSMEREIRKIGAFRNSLYDRRIKPVEQEDNNED